MLSDRFIAATTAYATLERHVPAPYLRKTFYLEAPPRAARLTVTGLGFYRLFLNGEEITASYLAPYISNPDHVVYYNEYEIASRLRAGKNVLGLLLGNGFLNNMGGFPWRMDEASFRSAPKAAFALELDDTVIEADESVRVHPSPITFDDLRAGERYDATLETAGWAEVSYDDSAWAHAIAAEAPRGEKRIARVEPITVEAERRPVSVTAGDGGYIYDFGINTAGIARLCIQGRAGQRIKLVFSEVVNDGRADLTNISLRGATKADYQQCVYYTCREGENVWAPSFCYMGYRYIYVTGITEEQATPALLTMLQMHSAIPRVCDFATSDAVAERLWQNTINSDYSNFFFFPTDCPHREKNGWTGDVALSAEQMLLHLDCERSLREWLFNIRKAQLESGKLPCLVPCTPLWGYDWGPGPAWDAALVEIPYRILQFTGRADAAQENSDAIMRYIEYMQGMRDERGLTAYGLGDWCQVDLDSVLKYTTPLCVSDTLVCADLCRKAAVLYTATGEAERAARCTQLRAELITAFRTHCIEPDLYVMGHTQTGQAMALFYGAFTAEEETRAYEHLRALIRAREDHFDIGVAGGRVLFRVLAEHGDGALAYRLITQPSFPSFGYHVGLGATSLYESFYRLNDRFEVADGRRLDILSQNHHFWGDIAAWFVEYIAGLRINPDARDAHHIVIAPMPLAGPTWARACRRGVDGEVSCAWECEGEVFALRVQAPAGAFGTVHLPNGETHPLAAGVTDYRVRLPQEADAADTRR